MKKTVYYLFIGLWMLTACDASFDDFLDEWDLSKDYQNRCPKISDAVEYPESWRPISPVETFEFPDETIRSMSTCGLLETWLNQPYRNALGPWCVHCSYLYYTGFYSFNVGLSMDKTSVELFERNDCAVVLINKYLSFIKAKEKPSGRLQSFELLLASDKSMSVLSKKEKSQVMAIALKKIGYEKKQVNETCHIIVAIMLTCDYTPFCEDIGSKLEDTTYGYTFNNTDSQVFGTGFSSDYHADIIVKYAKQFLNEQK